MTEEIRNRYSSGENQTPTLMKTSSARFHLRPARESDARTIQRLIKEAGINPTGLDWQRFTLAVDPQDDMIGCVQVKPHRDGSQELASLAVEPEWQEQGIGQALVNDVLRRTTGTLYLTCRASLGPYYERFGFQAILLDEMPPYFKRVYRLFTVLKVLPVIEEGLLVMRR